LHAWGALIVQVCGGQCKGGSEAQAQCEQ